MSYYWIRQLHITTVVITIGFFALRFYWMMFQPYLEKRCWVRILSVSNDTLLLCAGISMAVLSAQYPLVAPWLTAKLIGLILYIVLGTLALKRARKRSVRIVCGLLALLSAGYIVWVATTRSATPWSL
ncbi:MAG: SirB2 family protein [Gammaproteobacteria bacterium]|nr:SirB2 family protein [Gammaproteobacteria bacterium]